MQLVGRSDKQSFLMRARRGDRHLRRRGRVELGKEAVIDDGVEHLACLVL